MEERKGRGRTLSNEREAAGETVGATVNEGKLANEKLAAGRREGDFTDTQIHQVLAPITSMAKALTVDPEAESRDLADHEVSRKSRPRL